MNYLHVYNQIIINRKNNPIKGYTERHHIVPRSLGGNNNKSNKVRLTAREHFICHLLLTKMYPKHTKEWICMAAAFHRMFCTTKDQKRYVCQSRWYEYKKKILSESKRENQLGINNSMYGKIWVNKPGVNTGIVINESELQNYLDNGWIRGHKKNLSGQHTTMLNPQEQYQQVLVEDIPKLFKQGWTCGKYNGNKRNYFTKVWKDKLYEYIPNQFLDEYIQKGYTTNYIKQQKKKEKSEEVKAYWERIQYVRDNIERVVKESTSWTEVGNKLGISRTCAIKRYKVHMKIDSVIDIYPSKHNRYKRD